MKRPYLLLLLAGLTLVTASCDDTAIDPFSNEGRFFTIYGFLDQLETEHAVRVIPVTRRAEVIRDPSDPQASIDARVFSVDLTTEQRREWTHALERLDNGNFGHVFRSRFIVQPGRRYRLEVHRSDGVITSAETQVPSIPDAALLERSAVVYSPDSSIVTQSIKIPGVASPWEIQAVYLMSNQNDGSEAGSGSLNGRFFVSYGREGQRTNDGGWEVTLQISDDTEAVRTEIAEFRAQGVYDNSPETVESMGVQLRMLDQNWDPPEGVFDPEVLAQPGVLSNVENGYGFFGSIGLYTQEWIVSREFALSLGFEW